MKLNFRRRRKSKYSRDKRKEYNLQRHYGLTLLEFEKLVKAQSGLCAICFQPFRERGPHVDHDHKSGRRRALLCHRCNNGLGFFLDEPALLVAAAKYLLKWRKEHGSTQTNQVTDHSGGQGEVLRGVQAMYVLDDKEQGLKWNVLREQGAVFLVGLLDWTKMNVYAESKGLIDKSGKAV